MGKVCFIKVFRAYLGKFRKIFLAPSKIACSYTYARKFTIDKV